MGGAKWSQCVDLGAKLQNGEHEVIDEIKKVGTVNLGDFAQSWGTLEQRKANDEIHAVNSVLRIIHHLKRVRLDDCNLVTDHLRILCDVFNGVKIHKLDISYNDDNDAETWRQLGILVRQCGLKTLEARNCNLTAEGLERFIQGTNGAQIHELDVSESYNLDAGTWGQLGILVHQCGLKTLVAWECNPTAECLERFIQGTNGAQFDELYFDVHDVDVCHLIGRIVHQCGLKKLYSWFPTSRCLKKLFQGMNGTHLDHVVMGLKDEDNFLITGVLKLLPLINKKLEIQGWEIDDCDVEDLQEKLDNDHLQSLTIKYGSDYLKASPMDLPPNLPKVEGLEVDETNGIVQLKWSPLSIPNVSYYIVVETSEDGKAVGDLINTNETSCRVHYLQSETLYNFFVWGYTNDAISRRVAGKWHKTGKIYEHQLTIPPGILQTNGVRSSDVLDTEANKQGNSEASTPGQMQTLNDWLKTAGQFESPMQSQLSENSQQGVIKTVEATNSTAAWRGNVVALQESDNPTHRKPELDLQQFILFRHAEGNLFSSFSSATSTAPAVPYASVHHIVHQKYIQQDTSNSVQQQPHQYPAVADGTAHNSADQGLQQPAIPVVNNPAPLMQEPQRFDANTSTGATEFAQLTTVNPSADYDMGASAAYGYPVDQSGVNVYQSTADKAAAFFTDQTHNNDMNAFQPTANQTATFSIDQTFNNGMNAHQQTVDQVAANSMGQTSIDMNAYQQTVGQAAANSMGQTSNNAMNDHPSNSGQIAANSLDQTSNIESDAMRTRLDKLESLVASFQNMMKMQDEKLKMQNQKMEIQDAKMKEHEETITKLENKVAALEGAGASASVDVCQLPFILPMKTKDDVEENENLLEEKEYETKLVELLSKVGGTGKVAVWRIMGKLFTDRLAKQYSWTGRKAGKNPLRKLKMKEIIFRAGLMKNVDNEPCEKAVMRWLKNASDREGGRERRNKRKGEKSGAKQTA